MISYIGQWKRIQELGPAANGSKNEKDKENILGQCLKCCNKWATNWCWYFSSSLCEMTVCYITYWGALGEQTHTYDSISLPLLYLIYSRPNIIWQWNSILTREINTLFILIFCWNNCLFFNISQCRFERSAQKWRKNIWRTLMTLSLNSLHMHIEGNKAKYHARHIPSLLCSRNSSERSR